MKILAPGIAIIGRYRPRTLNPSRMSERLFAISKQHNLQPFSPKSHGVKVERGRSRWTFYHLDGELRFPEDNLDIKSRIDGVNAWHHDRPSTMHREKKLGMVLWSNREQTEIRLPDGEILVPNPGDVALMRNADAEHKTPTIMSPDRWFFRQFVVCPDWL